MRDALGLVFLILLLLGGSTAVVGIVCLTTAGGRALRRFLFPAPRVRLVRVTPAPLRYVWVACDTPRCGHLQTPHYPASPGRVQCNHCGAIRPRP